MTTQGLREAELAMCDISAGLPFSNNNAIMRNTEFELHCAFFFEQTIAIV